NSGTSAVTSSKIACFASLCLAIGPLEHRPDMVVMLVETSQFRPALDSHTEGLQPLDQQTFVGVLGIAQCVRIWAQALAHASQRHPRSLDASDPKVGGRNFHAGLDDRIGKANLSIELQSSRLHRHRAGSGAWLGNLVDDPHAHAELGQPEGKYKASRPCPNDQNKTISDGSHLFTSTCHRRPR